MVQFPFHYYHLFELGMFVYSRDLDLRYFMVIFENINAVSFLGWYIYLAQMIILARINLFFLALTF